MSWLASSARRVVESRWRDPLVVLAFFGAGVLLHLAGLYTLWPQDPNEVSPWRLGVLAAACLPLLMRSSHPVLALVLATPAIVVDLATGFSLVMPLVIGDALYCATLYGSPRFSRAMVWLAAGTPMVSLPVFLALVPDWRTAVLATLQVTALPVIPVSWAREVRQHREIAAAERARASQLARIAELDRQAAITEERSRMARDLHDVIAGHLSAIAIQSEAVLSMADRDPATVRTVLGAVRENSVAALVEMRAMINLLRAGDSASPDSRAAPPRLVELSRLVDSARAGGLRVEVTEPISADELPPVIDLTAYRIIQEALTNATKHAEGARAWVSLRREDDQLLVEVTNELLKNAPRRTDGAGTGLTSMAERAATVGGRLTAGPCGDLWRVRAELPIRLDSTVAQGR